MQIKNEKKIIKIYITKDTFRKPIYEIKRLNSKNNFGNSYPKR